MTEEQFKKANELIKSRDYYKNILNEIEYSQRKKEQEDINAKKIMASSTNCFKEKWTLSKYFRVRLWNRDRKPTIGLLPRFDLAKEIEIDADKELIDMIQNWLKKKVIELNEQIKQI